MAWVYSFVEFFYGDCLPRLPARQGGIYKPMSFEIIFDSFLAREELEYTLSPDAEQYVAPVMSRWDNLQLVMVFASTLRSLRMLQATKLSMFKGPPRKYVSPRLESFCSE